MMSSPPGPPDPADIAALVARIDADPDPLHWDRTPAVEALIRVGWPAAPLLLDRMLDASEDTRLRAQRALEGILLRELGFVAGRGFTREGGEARFRALWDKLGGYAFDADPEDRQRAVCAWKEWLTLGRPESSP